MEVDVSVCVTNKLHGNRLKTSCRYFFYFLYAFVIFLRRNTHRYAIAWQQFFGINLAFFLRLFHCRKRMNLSAMKKLPNYSKMPLSWSTLTDK